jgi:hypothetical protein
MKVYFSIKINQTMPNNPKFRLSQPFILSILAILFLNIQSISAQSDDEKAIKATISQLFDGMRKSDSSMVRAVFQPHAQMQTMFMNSKTNKPQLDTEKSVDGFVKTIGTPHKELYDERLLSWDIKIDGVMAVVWTPYEFWLGDKYSHCGVDMYVLFKGEQGWKITYLADTRRKNCK